MVGLVTGDVVVAEAVVVLALMRVRDALVDVDIVINQLVVCYSEA